MSGAVFFFVLLMCPANVFFISIYQVDLVIKKMWPYIVVCVCVWGGGGA